MLQEVADYAVCSSTEMHHPNFVQGSINNRYMRNLGRPFELMIPVAAVIGIFAKENGQGLSFKAEEPQSPPPANGGKNPASKSAKSIPNLKIVK